MAGSTQGRSHPFAPTIVSMRECCLFLLCPMDSVFPCLHLQDRHSKKVCPIDLGCKFEWVSAVVGTVSGMQ